MDAKQEQLMIGNFLTAHELHRFISDNLKESLASIGFSARLMTELVEALPNLDVEDFQKKFPAELTKVYEIEFFQKIVPHYFEQHVIPEIPASGKILDVGCGTGILIQTLFKAGKFDQLTGIDINAYSEWKSFEKTGITFKVVLEKNFSKFLDEYGPDSIVLTWALHHMQYPEQERYLKNIVSKMKNGSLLIVLEDSYSQTLTPEHGEERWKAFMALGTKDRKIAMSVYDWIANRVLAQRKYVPIPFAYRTMEEWIELCRNIGLSLKSKKFIGFPEQRDINTPQGLMVFRK